MSSATSPRPEVRRVRVYCGQDREAWKPFKLRDTFYTYYVVVLDGLCINRFLRAGAAREWIRRSRCGKF